jgi:predicted regulator of Ras-like GTPase activity (Roadblock/LC7/MglB family)
MYAPLAPPKRQRRFRPCPTASRRGHDVQQGLVQQMVVELEYGYLVVTESGDGACLALLASVTADLGMVAHEMNVIVQQVGSTRRPVRA